jgi:uncharacterized repeat protein (TIGR03803 family)
MSFIARSTIGTRATTFLCGVAFGILMPPHALAQTESMIHSFNYRVFSADGCPPNSYNVYPHTGLVSYKGHLYGTTIEGGPGVKGIPGTADGSMYALAAPESGGTTWDKKTLHNFIADQDPADGTFPCSTLSANAGLLYGTTISGGQNDHGTLFVINTPSAGVNLPPWTETIVYNFTGGADGTAPYDGLAWNGSEIFGVSRGGTTNPNGSNVFQISGELYSSYTEQTIHSNNVGDIYNGDLLVDYATAQIFGTSPTGGAYKYGYVYSLTLTGGSYVFADIWDFTGGADGAYPNGGLVGRAGDLFGTTQGGGESIGCCGVLFELRQETAGDPLYSDITWNTFRGSPGDGSIPVAGLDKDSNGNIWGTTSVGGLDNLGTIFELYPDRTIVNDWHYEEVYSFTGGTTDGANPQSLLTEDKNGNLYGTTNSGGQENEGAVFRWIP